MMRQLIAGNWKMNGSRASTAQLLGALRDRLAESACDVLVCPSFVHLTLAEDLLAGSSIMLGGQDCQAQPDGAFTGDVSATMLRDTGASWVILGHSERRQGLGETNAFVRKKAIAAQKAGLTPIVAIGETADQRKNGQTDDILTEQLSGSLPDDFSGVIAYEPIWAIGTGNTPDDLSIVTTIKTIRQTLLARFPATGPAMRILYGGSVTADNAASLLALPGVGGALVGGASLKAEPFLSIVSASALLCSGNDTV